MEGKTSLMWRWPSCCECESGEALHMRKTCSQLGQICMLVYEASVQFAFLSKASEMWRWLEWWGSGLSDISQYLTFWAIGHLQNHGLHWFFTWISNSVEQSFRSMMRSKDVINSAATSIYSNRYMWTNKRNSVEDNHIWYMKRGYWVNECRKLYREIAYEWWYEVILKWSCH